MLFHSLPSIYDWSSLECVPRCISLNLKTCLLKNYTGTNWEFEFAKYIMENAKFLKDMIICFDIQKVKLDMIEGLSSCSKLSPSCNLSFKQF